MTASPTLFDSQHWLLSVMTASQGVDAGLAQASATLGLTLEDMIVPPPRGNARARVAVYAGGYVQRLLECLRADFPLLARVMGEELFDFFARRYLQHCPSRSTTLYDLGAHFPGFLAASQPAAAAQNASLALPVALAQLERAYVECLRAPGLEHTAPELPDWWLGLDAHRWHVPPCVRLLALPLPLAGYWHALRQLDASAPLPETPALMPSWIALTRQHWRVSVLGLQDWQYQLLRACQHPADAALPHRAGTSGEHALWLHQAADLGLLTPVVC